MSTRSNIGIVNSDKSITSIYCHHDGYLSYVGKTLLNHYKTVDIINELMNLGDLSSIGEYLYANGHTWRVPIEGVCIAYGRDRGEKNVDSVICEDLGQYEDRASDTGAEYQYLFDNGKWMYRNAYKPYNGGWLDLTVEDCK